VIKNKVLFGAAGSDAGCVAGRSARRRDGKREWLTYTIPAPRAGPRDLEGQQQWPADRRRRGVADRHL